MGAKHEDANLILRLYELRREAVMRQARLWFFRDFHPKSAAEIAEVLRGENSAYYRMLTTYWEMACTLVKHGAIDAEMFNEANGEHVGVFAKLEPFLAELRQTNPRALVNVEKVVRAIPNIEPALKAARERYAAARAKAAQ